MYVLLLKECVASFPDHPRLQFFRQYGLVYVRVGVVRFSSTVDLSCSFHGFIDQQTVKKNSELHFETSNQPLLLTRSLLLQALEAGVT